MTNRPSEAPIGRLVEGDSEDVDDWTTGHPVVFPYTLVLNRTILDGWPGIKYAWERFVAECVLSIELFRQ